MPLYHGTKATFDRFEADAQRGGQLGSAFYFTDTEAVAANFAGWRDLPEFVPAASEAELDQFAVDHPDWVPAGRTEVGGTWIGEFHRPDRRPKVLTVEVEVGRTLLLDAPPPDDLLAALAAAGVPAEHWATAADAWSAAEVHFNGGPVDPDDGAPAAVTRLHDLVRALAYDTVSRPDERNGVAHRTWIVFDPERIRITASRTLPAG